MQERNISQTCRVEAAHIVVHICNKAHLRPNCDKTPYELWHGKPTSIKNFRVFGIKCFINNNDEKLGKYDARADEGIFLGYASKSKGYRCYNKRLHKIVESIDVRFDEDLPNKTRSTSCANPPDDHEDENQENEEQSKTTKDTELNSKGPSRHIKKNHPEDQIIGDKSAGVQTRRQLAKQTEEVYLAMMSQIDQRISIKPTRTKIG